MIMSALPESMKKAVAVLAVVGVLGGCASAPAPGEENVNDPIEGLNRYLFEVNMGLDKLILRPIAEVYRAAVPDLVQNAVRSFLDNLATPVILANDLMQGSFDRAWTTLARFGINTTAGGLGFHDTAKGWGYERHGEDFGQTLGTWGAGEGPYLMLPLFGPSNPRDAVGRVVDFFLDPLNWYLPGQEWAGLNGFGPAGDAAQLGRTIADTVDSRARNIEALDTVEKNALDFYATIRSLYRQRRADEIRNGKPTSQTNVPSVSEVPPATTKP